MGLISSLKDLIQVKLVDLTLTMMDFLLRVFANTGTGFNVFEQAGVRENDCRVRLRTEIIHTCVAVSGGRV